MLDVELVRLISLCTIAAKYDKQQFLTFVHTFVTVLYNNYCKNCGNTINPLDKINYALINLATMV